MNTNILARAFAIVLPFGLAALASGGCGTSTTGQGSSSTGGVTYKYPEATDFCNALAGAECSAAVVTACYGSSASSLPTDTQSCVAAASAMTRCNPKNLTQYDPAAADNCVSVTASTLSTASLTATAIAAISTACLPVFSNDGAAGSTCTADTDCATGQGYRCVTNAGASTCAIPVPVAAGEDCSAPASVCDAGFYCDSGSHCVSDPGSGGTCSATIPCGMGFQCASGLCIAQGVDGDSCTAASNCANGFCTMAAGQTLGKCASTETLQSTSTNCAPYQQ